MREGEREREKALTRNRMKVGSSFKTTALISGILVYVCTGGAGGSNRAGALRTKRWRRLENAFPVGYLDQPRKEDRFQGSSRATCARSPPSSSSSVVTSKKDLKEREGEGEDEASCRVGAGWQRSGDQADFPR